MCRTNFGRDGPHFRQRLIVRRLDIKPLPQLRCFEGEKPKRAFTAKRQRAIGNRQQFRGKSFGDRAEGIRV